MKRALVLALSLVLIGCTTGNLSSRLSPGMSKNQVSAIMGRPDGFYSSGKTETFKYTNKMISGWSWDRSDYYATFEGDRLVSYGSGDVRQNQPVKSYAVGIIPAFPNARPAW